MQLSKALVLALSLAAGNAFVIVGPARAPRARAAAVRMDAVDAVDPDFEECIVNAESAAEIAACSDDTEAKKAGFDLSFMTQMFKKGKTVEVDETECIVNAESALEIEDCKN